VGSRYPWTVSVGPPRYGARRRTFSSREVRELGLAILGLTGAVVLLSVVAAVRRSVPISPLLVGVGFAAAFVSVGAGVGLHEIAHKLVARSYGHWAEFRWNPRGIALAYFLAFFGFIYGAPGATMVAGNVTSSQNGKISAAGPATNLALALAFLAGEVGILAFAVAGPLWGYVLGIVANGAFINLILGGFNMIPVLPFDGVKVWRWSPLAYGGLLGAILGVLAAAFIFGLLL